MYKNFIFDLDGTLINSFDEVIKCFIQAFAKADYPIDKSRLTTDIIGPPLDEIVLNIAPELKDNREKLAQLVDYYNLFYDNETDDISVVYDGVYDLLKTLKKDNCRIFMATYKPKASTMRIVKQFNLMDYFEEIYTIDMFGDFITKTRMIETILEKYNLKKEETLMIGDAVSDMTCAKSVGVLAVGALWGYGAQKQNLINRSDIVLNNIEELNTDIIKKVRS